MIAAATKYSAYVCMYSIAIISTERGLSDRFGTRGANVTVLTYISAMVLETQRCYICGAFYDDKVKLGLHLSPCYNEAITVRRETWHPHPLDLVDDQRYTEYMRGEFRNRERNIERAQKQGVSFVTADNFDAIKTSIASTRNIPASGMGLRPASRGSPSSPVSPSRPVSSSPLPPVGRSVMVRPPEGHDRELRQRDQVAHPVRQVATGVTMLRNELTEELAKIRHLRQTEEHLLGERQRVFEEMCEQIGGSMRRPNDATSRLPPPPVATARLMEPLLPRPHSAQRHAETSLHRDGAISLSPLPTCQVGVGRSTATVSPIEMGDGRLKCPWCAKLFGRKGFEVHAKRCSRPDNDFTWSRDAAFVREHPEERVKADHDRVSYGRQFEERPEGMSDEAWQQFMVTYPRPILPDAPQQPPQRPVSPARQNALNQMVNNELSRRHVNEEVTVPCSKCGRYFYKSRVAVHESTCVSRLKR